MKNFKYVDFSKKTAHRNPDMVIHEYERLIEEINIKLSKSKTGLIINIPITTEFIINVETLREYIDNNHIDKSYKYELSFTQIENLYKEIIKNFQSEKNLIKTLENIKEELQQFKLKFKTIKYY